MKNRVAVASLVVGLIGGGVAGAALGITTLAGADSSSSTTVAPNTPNTPSAGSTPHSNEDTTHEQSENPQREADENAGRVGGHHGDNESTAHDSAETPQRESQEDAGSGSTPTTQAPASRAPAQ